MKHAVSVSNISVQRGAREILHQVSCDIAEASCTVIIGPNGAGKTSLLKAILGVLPIAGGDILLNGVNLQDLNYSQRAQMMSYVPQQSALQFPLLVRDVILQGQYSAFGSRIFVRLSDDAQLELDQLLERLDLSAVAGRSFNQLSGGEQRRVLLARALASHAPMLILDEPTAHVDMQHVLEMKKQIQRLKEHGKTVLVVVHDLQDAADIADNVLLMDHGQLVAQGSVEELVDKGFIEQVYGVRIEKTLQYTFHEHTEYTVQMHKE